MFKKTTENFSEPAIGKIVAVVPKLSQDMEKKLARKADPQHAIMPIKKACH